MDKWCKRIFENRIAWGHVICVAKAKINQESRTFFTKEWWIVQNGPRQQTTIMFNNNKNTNGDERITWRTFKKAFCNWNNLEENIGCWILVVNYVQGHAWLLQILWCMSKNKRIGNSKFCKTSHKSLRGTIYEMGTWFCEAN
jgi:hypothetical protein